MLASDTSSLDNKYLWTECLVISRSCFAEDDKEMYKAQDFKEHVPAAIVELN